MNFARIQKLREMVDAKPEETIEQAIDRLIDELGVANGTIANLRAEIEHLEREAYGSREGAARCLPSHKQLDDLYAELKKS